MSSFDTSRDNSAVTSTRNIWRWHTNGKAIELSLRFGRTKPTAFAAPVVVGTIEDVAVRARRKSLCGASRRR